MFRSFNGEFRRKPEVSIRGASKTESKEELLLRAQADRTRRENLRLETQSAIRIQSLVRRFLVSRRFQRQFRAEFDQLRRDGLQGSADRPDAEGRLILLHEVLKRLFLFFQASQDKERLVYCCQSVVAEKERLLPQLSSPLELPGWKFKIARLLELCVRIFQTSLKEENINACLRVFEIMTSEPSLKDITYFFTYLFPRNYFESLRRLCDARIPPVVEESARPPTPMAAVILDMIIRPLKLMSGAQREYKVQLVKSLGRNFFAVPFSEQVRMFILPAIAESNFPTLDWISAINVEDIEVSQHLLFSFLQVGRINPDNLSNVDFQQYLAVLGRLTVTLTQGSSAAATSGVNGGVGEESDDEEMKSDSCADDEYVRRSIELLNDMAVVGPLVAAASERSEDPLVLRSLCSLCHNFLLSDKSALRKYALLNTLAFRPVVIRRLWNLILDTKQSSSLGKPIPLLTLITKGIRMNRVEQEMIVPPLAVFVSLFGYLLITVHDTEFFGDGTNSNGTNSRSSSTNVYMPFSLSELIPMSLLLRDLALGLVELAYPESRPTVREDYQQAVRSVRNEGVAIIDFDTKIWSHLFEKAVDLLRQLYTRDTRRQYCPDEHWLCKNIYLPVDRPNGFSIRRSRLRQYRPFQGLRVFTREELDEEGPPLTTKEVRLATILREMPYAVTFSQRVLVFSNLISRDKSEHQGDLVSFGQGASINVSIRRNYIYEDAFDKLSVENEPNLRLKMRVQLKNAVGLDEAGIDGGGLFREFMTELLKTAFDPNRGFFKLTIDQQLYPNPAVQYLEPAYIKHYFFIGRLLGKALYENHLIELPMASFFLSKIFGLTAVNADIDNLSSLDPELYKNLLYLKTYDGDVQDLNLDFTIVSEEVGKTTIDELKPGGADIPVLKENRIEYIHLMADYKLNRQIRTQCNAFRKGIQDVINLDWLRMFSCKELQTLISGAEHEIDVEDLQKHCKYGNGFTGEHPTIIIFWNVVRSMDEKTKRSLLKFVTSCSRPPLLGFKELDPPFCIQNVGDESTRLPTASTCMNLLKLPEFKDETTLKTKLTYAIESGSGFELS